MTHLANLNSHLRSKIMNTLHTSRFLIPAIIATVVSVSGALAATPTEKGTEIAREIDRRDLGFGDSRAKMEMHLSNRHGEKSVRKLRLSTLENTDTEAGDKSLTVFSHPRDIKGTAFLSFTKILDPDDQWLYLPALKRVKRISSANKSGPFVGSEFAYEDLVSFEVGKYDYKWLRDEACGELECFVVERTPKYENSGYTRQVTWVDKAEYRIQKVDFYDRKESLLKTLVQSNFEKYLDKYWRPLMMVMTNHQTGKATNLVFAPYEFRVGVNENDFTPNRLKKIR
jgi:outer membrane lipoprotein-sorting protein